MEVNLDKLSIVFWLDDEEPKPHRCGYCKGEGSISYGMHAERLTVEDYQGLIDRGWRRSGQYCYKPVLEKSCCPQYTIKCDALNFNLSKSHKKIIKKFNKFFIDGKLVNDKNDDDVDDEDQVNVIASTSSNNSNNKSEKKPKAGSGADPDKPPCKKAKLLRKERKLEKLSKDDVKFPKQNSIEPKTLEDFLEEIPDSKLKLKLITPVSEEWEVTKDKEFELYKKYQIIVHNDPPGKLTFGSFHRFLCTSPLKIKLVQMSEDHETFEKTANLYAKYQMIIHEESASECNLIQFINFLVDTPLQYKEIDNEIGFGTYHQQYWIDDQLIAVGVIDILPKCVSSVYFFYDPDYRSLTLGTYGSLRELQLTRKLHEKVETLTNYYMGFYIHSCPKMRYKGKLVPSYLLCPETYNWIPIEKCLVLLDREKYSRLDDDLDKIDPDHCSAIDLDEVKIWLNSKRSLTKYAYYKKRYNEQQRFDLIGQFIGKNLATRMLFVF